MEIGFQCPHSVILSPFRILTICFTIALEQKENTTSQAPDIPLDIFDIYRHSINHSKIKINSKVIKSHQFSLEISHAKLIELNSEF